MRFGWDPAKSRTNVRDHGIDFGGAVAVFAGPTWERLDDRRDYGEERWVAVGSMYGVAVTVVYTDVVADGEPDPVRWIISARRATRHERETYYREVEGGGQ